MKGLDAAKYQPERMLIAALLFVVLLVAGVMLGELEWRPLLAFVLAAGGGFAAFVIFQWPFPWYTVMLAVLDIVLVLWVFKGNVSL